MTQTATATTPINSTGPAHVQTPVPHFQPPTATAAPSIELTPNVAGIALSVLTAAAGFCLGRYIWPKQKPEAEQYSALPVEK